jgi:hypothetical protein
MKNLIKGLRQKWECWRGRHEWEFVDKHTPTIFEILYCKSYRFCNFEHWQCKHCPKISRKDPTK